MIPPTAASDTMHRANGSKYITYYEEIIACGSILSGTEELGSDPEAVRPLNNLIITYRALIWENMVKIFQGSDAWTYLNPAKTNFDVRMGYKFIYNHYLSPSNIYHMTAGAEKKLAQCTYTAEKRNWTLERYTILHKEKHNTLDSLKDNGYTGIDQISKVR